MQLRGWYAGALTLMLAAAALILRPTATRVAVAVYAVFCTSMVLGLGPLFTFLTSSVPGFDTAHNQRMLIYVLLALALLAGFGLDDLSDGRLRSALPPPPRGRGVGRHPRGARALDGGRRDPDDARARARARRRLGLREPAVGRPAPGRHPPGRHRPDERAAAVAPAGRRRPRPRGAAGAARAPAGGGAVRRARRRPADRRPVPGQHGLQPGDPHRGRRPAPDRRDRRAPAPGAEPLRRDRQDVLLPAAAARHVDALRPLRRARLRLPRGEAVRPPLAAQRGAGRAGLHAADRAGHRDPGLAARAEPPERQRRAAGDGRPAPGGARPAGRLPRPRRDRLPQHPCAPADVPRRRAAPGRAARTPRWPR